MRHYVILFCECHGFVVYSRRIHDETPYKPDHMKNRAVSFIYILLTAVFSAVTAVAQSFEADGLKFDILSATDHTVNLSGGTVENGVLDIPGTVYNDGTGYTVTGIAWWAFKERADIVSVNMPNSIRTVGASAFVGCAALTEVRWSENLKTLGQFCFSSCTSLQKAILPEGLETLGNDAFYLCTGMTEIHLPASLLSIGEAALAGCDNLTELVIPEKITVIRTSAISGEKIETLVLPAGLETIERMGVSTCFALKEVRLPEGLKSIAADAFFRCDGLKTVYAPWARPVRLGDSGLDDATVHVPVNTSKYYKAASYWKYYTIVEDPALGAYYDISVVAPEHGTVTLRSEGKDLTEGYIGSSETLEIVLTPDEGYELKSLTVNGKDVTETVNGGSCLIHDPDSDMTIEAVFGLSDHIWLTIRQADGGQTRVRILRGADVTLSLTAESGWSLHSVTVNGADMTSQVETDENILRIPSVGSPVTVNVSFEKDTSGGAEVPTGVEADMRVTASDGDIVVGGVPEGYAVRVYTTGGMCLRSACSDGDVMRFSALASGIYIVSCGSKSVKIGL